MAKKNKLLYGTTGNLSKKTRSRISYLFEKPIEPDCIDNAISRLKHNINKKKEKQKTEHCFYPKDNICLSNSVTSANIVLKARHCRTILKELRKALLLHDWDSATKLLSLAIDTGDCRISALVTKACILLITCSSYSSPDILKTFIKNTTAYENEEDIEKFAAIICSIRHGFPRFYTVAPRLRGKVKLISDEKITLLPLCDYHAKKEALSRN